jgi:hypothetical protein
MYTLLSLFDYSGNWSKPFEDRGWNVIRWDIKLSEFMDIMSLSNAEISLDLFGSIDGIIAAPPCTDFTVSGAQYWPIKDADGRTETSLEYVRQVLRLADLFEPTDPEYDGPFFWTLENPVGRLPKLLPALNDFGGAYYFHPYEFAGYTSPTKDDLARLDNLRLLDGKGLSDSDIDLILETNAYTKKTGLWGNFNRDIRKDPIQPIKASSQGTFTQRYGGKSENTKEKRSNTPRGFAEAFCIANLDYRSYLN